MEEMLENKEYCKNCGGYCCKKCGCDYYPEDFKDLSFNALTEILSARNISIVSFLNFEKLPNGKLIYIPFLYLRARNVDRDIVDLVSIKKTCSMLKDDGCSYNIDNRPSGGVNLIPASNRLRCHHKENHLKHILEWERYQKVLAKFVKKYCGMSVEDKLKEDIENLFYECLIGVLDTVPIEEQEDIKKMLPSLIQAAPIEYLNAEKRYKERGVSKKLSFPSDKIK